jgi:predicted O-methyltransferase YrrM
VGRQARRTTAEDRVASDERYGPLLTQVIERQGILRGTKSAWSEGGAILVTSRFFRLAAETLQRAAESLEIAGATMMIRRFRPASLDQAIEFAERFEHAGISIRPMQIRSEIRNLLDLIALDPPRTVLEIGTGRGGTLFLIAQVARPDALLISVDFPEAIPRFGGQPDFRRRTRVYQSVGRGAQRVVVLDADSHLTDTRTQIEQLLAGTPLDVLFIDGDHTAAGVTTDFRMYSPLVRSGGLVAFHDIVPGPAEAVGGVPAFWQKTRNAESMEFVEDWKQGGYGIGVLRV